MNAANLCPMPAQVRDAVAKYSKELSENMSPMNRGRIEDLKERARTRLAKMLHVSGDEIALTRNTSEANNIVVQGLDLNQGEEVLLWDQNHPSNSVSWRIRAHRMGFKVRYFSIPSGVNSIDEVVNIVSSAVSTQTKVVSFTHVSNVTGFRLPAREICQAIKEDGDIYVHIDGAQTWGAYDINLRDLTCDSFSASAHKWFMGPREVGLLYVNEERIERLWPNIVSWPWGNQLEPSVTGARKFESMGQRNDSALAALVDAVDFNEKFTPVRIAEHAMLLSDNLRDKLASIDVDFVSPNTGPFSSAIVIVAVPSKNVQKLVDHVIEDSGVIVANTGGLRMSPHFYNTVEHNDRVVASIRKYHYLLSV